MLPAADGLGLLRSAFSRLALTIDGDLGVVHVGFRGIRRWLENRYSSDAP
jgi:hypothetical protein